ncbi:MAG: molybdopterin-synthase adenylyltransferase MoeB [Opitutaceae bacterium]|nr:molybdopterin-synthase adenylyltransferase MoeB [Opitutaceae bacterium]
MPPPGAPTAVLSPAELARYSRHILLPGVGVEGQQRLAAAKVLVIGAGGLGSPAALYLAAAGIGTLGIADFDKVELHNLQRQILHDTTAVGHPKVASASTRLSALNPHIRVVVHAEGVTAANALALFAGYDVIVDGTDHFPTRYLNNDAAVLTRRPLVYGSIFQFEGQVSVFDPTRGAPCYRCLFPSPPPAGSVPNCGEAGVLGALCGTIGSLQAMEAIKLILGLGEPLHGRLVVFDALGHRFRTLNVRRDPACPLCGTDPQIHELRPERYAFGCAPLPATASAAPAALVMPPETSPTEIDVATARDLFATGTAALLDVREPYEHAICQLPGSQLVPMREVPAMLDQLPRDRPLLVLCHHGGRSERVTRFLRSNGFARATNICGGIDAWAAELDPSLQRY